MGVAVVEADPVERGSRPRPAFPQRHARAQQFLSSVWDHTFLGDSRLVDAAVGRLRAKPEDVPARPRYVQTVRGFDHRFGPL
ncbi:winged helix-turn-helix domain-containing protein [Streptomyces cinereoruber]|uniref:winged helix-turn-helix domain-containing protein n=1 Tax=Streptomyces cinereoruber TaxID=67260 RepID=UPI003F52FB3D